MAVSIELSSLVPFGSTSGRFRIIIVPYVGSAAQPQITLYDTGGTMKLPKLSTGIPVEVTLTPAGGVTALRLWFECTTPSNVLSLSSVSLRQI